MAPSKVNQVGAVRKDLEVLGYTGRIAIATGNVVARQRDRSLSSVAYFVTSNSLTRSCSALSKDTSRASPTKFSSPIRTRTEGFACTGFSLHAGVACKSTRKKLERLCHHTTRP